MGTINGLSSNPLGFNSQDIITQLVNSEYGPSIDRINSRIDQAESTQSAFKDLNSAVDNLQSKVEELTNLSTFNTKKASSSNSDIVGASIVDSDKATSGTDQLFVEQLASTAKVKSGQFINNRKVVDNSNFGADDRAATSVSDFEQVSGSETLDPSSDTLQALSNEVETSGGGMGSGGDGVNEVRIDFNNNGTFTEFDLDSFDTIGDFMSAVNSSAANDDGSGNQLVEFSYDQSTDQFKLIPQQPGGSFQVDDIQSNLSDSSKGFFQQVGIAENETVHTFDNTQSEADIDNDATSEGLNVISVDPSKTFDDNLFSTSLSSNSGTIKVNNTEIDFDTTSDSKPSTINELVTAINDDVSGVTAKFDSATDKITLESEKTGNGDITVEDVSGNLAQALNLRADGTAGSGGSGNAEEILGKDAQVGFNGTTIFESNNTFSRNGVEYDLKEVYKQTNNTGDPIEVSVEKDGKAVTEKVSSFVDSFNKVIENINSNSNVDAPDSPDGENNESGPFVGSSTAQLIKRRLTSIVSKQFKEATGGGEIQNSSNVGIELNDPFSGSPGKINFDEGKFKEALADNPENVKELFAADETDPDLGGNQDGIATQLNSFTKDATGTDGFISTRIDGFDRRIENLNDRLERQRERAQDKQERLQDRFLRLEQQVIRLQGQQSRLGRF